MHKSKESGTEIGNSLEFDFVVPPPQTIERLGQSPSLFLVDRTFKNPLKMV